MEHQRHHLLHCLEKTTVRTAHLQLASTGTHQVQAGQKVVGSWSFLLTELFTAFLAISISDLLWSTFNFLQNHQFVDEKTYESSFQDVVLLKAASSSSVSSSSSSSTSPYHGFTSCCSRRKRKSFNVPNNKMSGGPQTSIQELSTIHIQDQPLGNR